MERTFLLIAACSGFLTVVIGAFGAHAVKTQIPPALYTSFQTGVHYQGLHTLALLVVALLMHRASSRHLTRTGWAFSGGILLFSGSLYLLALTGLKPLGMITPIGGISFLLGWFSLILAVIEIGRDAEKPQ